MKILYVSGHHNKMEHDEIEAFLELGYELFSTGHYKDFEKPSSESFQESINGKTDPALLAEFNKLNPNFKIHNYIALSKEFVDKFDIVIMGNCCPLPDQIDRIWESIKHKPIIYRTYAQQQPQVEHTLSNLRKQGKITLVRVAKSESNIQHFAGLDFVIVGFIDENKFSGWNGFGGEILTFNNFFSKRAWHSNTPSYRRIVDSLGHPFSLYGQYNEDAPLSKGVLPVVDQIKAYQNCGVYFSLGSKPAALTYSFQEALMVGCPLVTWGRKMGGATPNLYAVPDLVENGIEAFLAESEQEAAFYIKTLLTNEKLAKDMSAKAREKSLKLSSKDENKKLWQQAIEFTLK